MACLVVDISRLERPQELPVASFGVVTPSISDWSRSTSGSTERSISASQSPYDSNGILGKTRFTSRPPNYGTRSTRTVELLLVLPVLARRPADKRWTGGGGLRSDAALWIRVQIPPPCLFSTGGLPGMACDEPGYRPEAGTKRPQGRKLGPSGPRVVTPGFVAASEIRTFSVEIHGFGSVPSFSTSLAWPALRSSRSAALPEPRDERIDVVRTGRFVTVVFDFNDSLSQDRRHETLDPGPAATESSIQRRPGAMKNA
jgi:hypothetical protein